jgi:hypothetical protein
MDINLRSSQLDGSPIFQLGDLRWIDLNGNVVVRNNLAAIPVPYVPIPPIVHAARNAVVTGASPSAPAPIAVDYGQAGGPARPCGSCP